MPLVRWRVVGVGVLRRGLAGGLPVELGGCPLGIWIGNRSAEGATAPDVGLAGGLVCREFIWGA